MTDRRLFLAAIAAGVAGLAASANADIIANWTFESSIPATAGPFAAEVGSGSALGAHAGAATYSSPAGNGSAHSFSSNTWAIGDYYQFSTSTVGYSSIAIQWDQTSSNTGPRDFKLSWSTNGTTFTDIGGTLAVLPNATVPGFWNSTTGFAAYTFGPTAGPASLDNQATVYFRLTMASNVSANGSTVQAGGSDRVDNVIITGAVPAPGAMTLLGLGGLIAGRRRRS